MAGKHFKHWQEVPDWLWPQNFHPRSDPMLASPDTGEIYFHVESFQALQRMRDKLGPLKVLSGYRSPTYNARKGGSPKSYHKELIAFDIRIEPYSFMEVLEAAKLAGFTGFGHYPTRGFLHVDMGRPRFWYGNTADKLAFNELKWDIA